MEEKLFIEEWTHRENEYNEKIDAGKAEIKEIKNEIKQKEKNIQETHKELDSISKSIRLILCCRRMWPEETEWKINLKNQWNQKGTK